MDLIHFATQSFMNKLGDNGAGLSENAVTGALVALLGGDDGHIDLGSIISKLSGGGLAALAQSWLGDSSNDAISARQILSLFGESSIGDFASNLNLDPATATTGLTGMLPELIDGNSRGGNLLDAIGGGRLGAAAKFPS
jgi:uncharacterized protein YidB (DUF937 family)